MALRCTISSAAGACRAPLAGVAFVTRALHVARIWTGEPPAPSCQPAGLFHEHLPRTWRGFMTVGREPSSPHAVQPLITTQQRHPSQLEGMHAVNDDEIYASTVARLTAHFEGQRAERARQRLAGVLRSIPPDQRSAEAERAIRRLARQEVIEAKIKALSDDDLDQISV
jgi:hypothetical protein